MNRLQTIDADTLQSTAYEPVSFVVSLCKICKTLFYFCGFRQVRHIFQLISLLFLRNILSASHNTQIVKERSKL